MRGLTNDLEIVRHDSTQISTAEVRIVLNTPRFLFGIQAMFEPIVWDAEDDVAVHLDESAVAVERETLTGPLGQTGHRLFVQPQIEDRIHHPGHRGPGP